MDLWLWLRSREQIWPELEEDMCCCLPLEVVVRVILCKNWNSRRSRHIGNKIHADKYPMYYLKRNRIVSIISCINGCCKTHNQVPNAPCQWHHHGQLVFPWNEVIDTFLGSQRIFWNCSINMSNDGKLALNLLQLFAISVGIIGCENIPDLRGSSGLGNKRHVLNAPKTRLIHI